MSDTPDDDREADWTTLATWAGIAGGAVALVYAVGAVVLLFRYGGFQFGAQTLVVTPREQILIRGGVALALWGAIGAAVITLVRLGVRLGARTKWPKRRAVGIVAVVACLLVLLLAHRWWVFVGVLAVPSIALAVSRWRGSPARWLPVSALAIAIVAAAYEADRLSYIVEWRCVQTSDGTETCGIDIATRSEGVYLGQPREPGSTDASQVLFIPSTKVESSHTVTREESVTPDQAVSRRQPLLSRLLGLDVR